MICDGDGFDNVDVDDGDGDDVIFYSTVDGNGDENGFKTDPGDRLQAGGCSVNNIDPLPPVLNVGIRISKSCFPTAGDL